MGLFARMAGRRTGRNQSRVQISPESARQRRSRKPQLEPVEPRKLLAADILFGAVYFEEATGDDTAADVVEVTFDGGAAGTTLDRLVMDGDKTGDGPSAGDVFFDVAAGGLGAFGHVGLTIESHDGLDVLGVTVVDGGSQIVLDLAGFEAGESLVFSVDVDELQFVDPAATSGGSVDPALVDTNPLVEGAEFQRSHMTGEFFAPAFEDVSLDAVYWDAYDSRFADAQSAAGTTLDLPSDRYDAQRDLSDRTAGAIIRVAQTPLPTIAGTVFHDMNLDNRQNATMDVGIAGVELQLWRYDTSAGRYLDTGLRAQTDFSGEYLFQDDGGPVRLLPGRYQVREVQPARYYSVGARAGTIDGQTVGVVTDANTISEIELPRGANSVGNDFAEALPSSISGHVYIDDNQDGVFQSGSETGVAGVQVRVVPVNILDGSMQTITATTDSSGFWSAENLVPGEYRLEEGATPAQYVDGLDAAGTIDGVTVGRAINPGDEIVDILLGGDKSGIDYNFGEVWLASISGRVQLSTDGDCDFENPDVLLEGVQIDLLDAAGTVLRTTFTNADGAYLFADLRPGEYQIREHTPAQFDGRAVFDGDEHVGTAGGQVVGNDTIGRIRLRGGADATNYDFCEHVGAMLSGYVYHDRNNDGVRDSGEEGIGGVTLMLLDGDMNPTGQTVITANDPSNAGFYKFNDLPPGVYGIMEVQPAGWLDGIDRVGNLGGIAEASPPGDKLHSFELKFGDMGMDYNFGELLPASIRGTVHITTDLQCVPQPNEPTLAGVTVELLDAGGRILATTQTDSLGRYLFDNLRPGSYTVRQAQPTEYFTAGAHVGSGGGIVLDSNTIADVPLRSGSPLVEYDFCENPAGSVSGYVFRDGPPILLPPTGTGQLDEISAIRDGRRTPDDAPLAGVTVELRQGASGDPIFGDQVLPGLYPSYRPIRTVTDGRGFYEFRGLPAGTYAVVEVQPAGFIDSIDTEGSTGGIAINPPRARTAGTPELAADGVPVPSQQRVVEQFRTRFGNDAIVLIPLPIGQHSVENNFSEVTAQPFWLPPEPTPELPEVAFAPPLLPIQPETFVPLVRPNWPVPTPPAGANRALGYTWHLSVVDAGFPRAVDSGTAPFRVTGTQFNVTSWQGTVMDEATWTFAPQDGPLPVQFERVVFGNRRALPVAGDFNGDGISEIAVFIDGEWFIDLNGDRRWDEADLWIKLGTYGDLPAVGDWNGDGKTDIAIFGPAWPRDPMAVAREPGLPDPASPPVGRWKNIPPDEEAAAGGKRVMQWSVRGEPRADLVDHVFHFGAAGDAPVTGDWNGDGVATIGVYRRGVWHLDVDGDGQFTANDVVASFREDGDDEVGKEDIPVVGDFNGDGIDEIGIFREGEWYLDTNRDYQFNAKDEVHSLGGAGDLPVVGDWDGDGADDLAVFQPSGASESVAQRPEMAN